MIHATYIKMLAFVCTSAFAASSWDLQHDATLLMQTRGSVASGTHLPLDDQEVWLSEDEIKSRFTNDELETMLEFGDVVTKTEYSIVEDAQGAENADVEAAFRSDQVPILGGGSSPETTTSEPDVSTTTAEPPVTTTPDCAQTGTCSIYEDPHIKVFDGVQISLLGSLGAQNRVLTEEDAGDMWLVRSSEISIQGRYLPDPDLPEGNLFVRALAVGGPFLNGSTLVVGPLEEQVTWNGKPILETQASDFLSRVPAGGVHAKRHTNSHLVQDMTQTNPGLDITLPFGVQLTVNRMKRHVNVFIEMPPATGGQEGLCGNFNCNSADDEMHMILAGRNPKVLAGESLFEQ